MVTASYTASGSDTHRFLTGIEILPVRRPQPRDRVPPLMRLNRSTLRRSPARIAGLALAWVALATSAQAVTFVSSTPIAGDTVSVTLSIDDAPEGDAVDVAVSIPAGTGDLLGLFGNAVPESLVAAMAVVDAGGAVTQ